MAIEHDSIPNADIHEPKDVSSASAGTVYVADGAGSGSWATADALGSGAAPAGALLLADGSGGLDFLRYQGWAHYEDTDTTVGSPSQALLPGVRTLWTNDGGTSIIDKKPSDATVEMWDTATNTHVPIADFDLYHLRMSFFAENYAGATPYIDIELDIGGSIGTIFGRVVSLHKGGSAQFISIAFPVFSGTTYNANGGKFYLTYQGTGSCAIYKSSILIVRESKNYV